ncbi:MAG TPA: DUF4287 domain-containing protein [Hyphomonadaceae bacterium]|nr:DUF4287 domain-containing protein [Hyphomonadaceae bacterium]
MSEMPPGFRIYLANATKLTGKSELDMLLVLSKSGLKKHGELREHAMESLGLGHGHANALAAYYLRPDWQPQGGKALKALIKPPPAPKPTKAPPPKPAPVVKAAAAKAPPPKPVAKAAAKPAPAPAKKPAPVAAKATAKKAPPPKAAPPKKKK